jgi:hypothetical protein
MAALEPPSAVALESSCWIRQMGCRRSRAEPRPTDPRLGLATLIFENARDAVIGSTACDRRRPSAFLGYCSSVGRDEIKSYPVRNRVSDTKFVIS